MRWISLFILKINQMKFTKAELNQLLSYIEHRERTNWYYGVQKHFEKRHLSIKEKIISNINNNGKYQRSKA